MRYFRCVLIIMSMLILNGCAETIARGVSTGAVVGDAIQERIKENLERRDWVLDDCWRGVVQRVGKLRAEDKHDEADKLLIKRRPSLLTERLANKILQSIEAGEPVNLPPNECGSE